MPAHNYRLPADVINVTAAAARTDGELVYEAGFPGIVNGAPGEGASYPLSIMGGYNVPLVEGAAFGNQVFISTDGDNTVGVAAAGTALSGSNAYVGRVIGVPGNGISGNPADPEPPAGQMSIVLAGYAHI